MRCEICKAFEAKSANGAKGICRRYAPKAGIWAGPDGRSAYYGHGEEGKDHLPNVLWPKVERHEWCCDFLHVAEPG